jgi:hypothetical protein
MESTVDPITIQGVHPHDPCLLALEAIASHGARAAVADRAQCAVGTSSITDFLEAPAWRLERRSPLDDTLAPRGSRSKVTAEAGTRVSS